MLLRENKKMKYKLLFWNVLGAAATFFSVISFAGPEKGGTFFVKADSDPATLNPITSTDGYASAVQGYVFETLLTRDDETYGWIPALAEKWEVSKDGTQFTYHLRSGVKWEDGKPLTAEDVKYSFDVFFEGRFQSPSMMTFLQNIKEVKIIDPLTVQFVTKDVYFKNFDVASSITIIPKHFYGVGDPKDSKFNKKIIGTGPYTLDVWEKGRKIILKRKKDYWGNGVDYFKNRYNFDQIFFRPVKEESVGLELLKKGDLDFLPLTGEQYMTKTKGDPWGKKIIAVKTENDASSNYNYAYIGWNFNHPFFKDRDVRLAMSHLINREFMNEKFRYNMSELAKGPFGNKSPASSPKVKVIEYNPKKALELLRKNGWKLVEKGLSKKIDGKDTLFEFTLISANADFDKYATVIKEDMKKVGITMNIKILEWNSFIKLVIDERKFDAANLAWAVNALESDPKQVWHKESIPAPGHNFISYKNDELSDEIDKLRKTMDSKKRLPIYHKIHEIIAADQPYSFLFNNRFTLYGHNLRIKKQKDTFRYSIGADTWWIQNKE